MENTNARNRATPGRDNSKKSLPDRRIALQSAARSLRNVGRASPLGYCPDNQEVVRGRTAYFTALVIPTGGPRNVGRNGGISAGPSSASRPQGDSSITPSAPVGMTESLLAREGRGKRGLRSLSSAESKDSAQRVVPVPAFLGGHGKTIRNPHPRCYNRPQ